MTKFVTERDALVLSPVDVPERPDQLPRMFDDFDRCAAALGDGRIFVDTTTQPRILSASADGMGFYARPILSDGRTWPVLVLNAWGGQITKDTVASFLRADILLYVRAGAQFAGVPRWGARMSVRQIEDQGDEGLLVTGLYPVPGPIIDPLRDAARWDDDLSEHAHVIPMALAFEPPWDELLTPWEHHDGFFGRAGANQLWQQRRKRLISCSSGRWWRQLRGLWETGDPDRYAGQWSEPYDIAVYLGWPAYFLDAAGNRGACRCGRPVPQGREFCGAPACNRERARERQRTSRAARANTRVSRGAR